MKLKFVLKGGSGSGNFDHAGRPGEQGGSAPQGGGGTTAVISNTGVTMTVTQGLMGDGKTVIWHAKVKHPDVSSIEYANSFKSAEDAQVQGTKLAKLLGTDKGRALQAVNNAFATSSRNVKDLEYISYTVRKAGVTLTDSASKFGHAINTVDARLAKQYGFADLPAFVAALVKGGATKAIMKRRSAAQRARDNFVLYD